MDDLQSLLRPLYERPRVAPQPEEWIAHQARRRTRRHRGLTVAATAVVVALPVVFALQRRSTSEPEVRTESSTGAPTTSRTASTTTPPPRSTDPFDPTVPWAGTPIQRLPAYAEAAARLPEVAASCPVLAFDDLGEGAGATPRASQIGDNSWSVEYDLPGAPGRPSEDAAPTPDAGRGTFAVSAAVLEPPMRDLPPPWGNYDSIADYINDRTRTHRWADGSIAGWGGPQPEPEAPDAPVADTVHFQVEGADPTCLYTVLSFLGEDHAIYLTQHLRRVAPEG